MPDKSARQTAIRELVAGRAVANQDVLRRQLARRGFAVTQSTLSRDLRELRLARIPDSQGGVRYAASDREGGHIATDALEAMLPALLVHCDAVGVLVVAKTRRSGAQPVAEALDLLEWPDVMGTVAGDDTVLVICRSAAGSKRVVRQLRAYIR